MSEVFSGEDRKVEGATRQRRQKYHVLWTDGNYAEFDTKGDMINAVNSTGIESIRHIFYGRPVTVGKKVELTFD